MKAYTTEQIVELQKCMFDIKYMARTYTKIIHPVKGEILFDLFDYQEEIIDLYTNNRQSIILSSRQMGKTETACLYLLHEAMFKENQHILVASNQQDGAVEILDRIKQMFESLPSWIVPDAPVYNTTSMKFSNGSKIVARATTAKTGRGKAISLLYLDEFAFVQKNIAEQFWSAIYPVISAGGRMIITSTPNGDNNRYYYIWRDAHILKEQEFEFASMQIHWSQHPDRDDKWAKQTKIALGDDSKWLQEYENSFLSNAKTAINLEILESLKILCDPKLPTPGICATSTEWSFYKYVKPKAEYFIFADVSEGIGADFHVINVFDENLVQVAMYRSNTDDDEEMAQQIKNVSDYYNDAYIFVERNGPGMAIFPYLVRVHEIGDRVMREKPGKPPGLRMNQLRRSKGITNMKNFVAKGRVKINNIGNINELKVFKKRDGGKRFEAEYGCYDDMVMTLVMLCSEVDRLINMNEQVYTALYETAQVPEGLEGECPPDETVAPEEALEPVPMITSNIGKVTMSDEDSWLYGG